jgi:hypothetical protein
MLDINKPTDVPTTLQGVIARPPSELKPYAGNARVHDEKQVTALMASIKQFGFQGANLFHA